MTPETRPMAGLVTGDEDTVVPSQGVEATFVPAKATVVPVGETVVPASARTTQARTTVLPTFTGMELKHSERERYRMVRVLGQGGMGEVSLAQDQDINRSVALKYLHPNLADPGMVARFVEEIRTIGHLEHPNIVPIHDVGLDEQGRYFFVMKHLEGETLEDIITKLRTRDPAYEAKYTFERRVELILGVLRALQFAHERGIIHRDLKPANIMVGRHGEVVVMDWGIAKAIGTAEIKSSPSAPPAPDRLVQTQLGSLIGTPMYMAPEQASGHAETMDARSDLYSVAVVLWELLTLEHYLQGRESLDAVLQGVATVIPNPSNPSSGTYPPAPAGFIHACVKGLQKDPALRFQSAEEMLGRLHRVLDGVGEVCCPNTALRAGVGQMGKYLDRNPIVGIWVGFGTIALVLASMGIAAFTVVHWIHG